MMVHLVGWLSCNKSHGIIKRLFSVNRFYEMSNTKHYAKGSKKPVFENDGQLRMYSMRFCPYAGRVHLVLDAKRIPYHSININLINKPEWLFEANPVGKVPCLQLVDKLGAPFVYESLLIAEYLDEVYPETKLYPTDPLEKLQEKIWIERFGPIFNKYHQAMASTDTAASIALWAEGQKLLDVFEIELKRRDTTYFGGDRQARILDYAIWPFIQLFEVTKELFGEESDFNCKRFPALLKWFHNLNENDEACRKFRIPRDTQAKFLESRRKNAVPDYDLLVPQ